MLELVPLTAEQESPKRYQAKDSFLGGGPEALVAEAAIPRRSLKSTHLRGWNPVENLIRTTWNLKMIA